MEKKLNPATIFGKNLREKRKEFGLTQERLAELIDVDRTYTYRLEAGKRSPSLSMIIKLATVSNLTPGHFLEKRLKK